MDPVKARKPPHRHRLARRLLRLPHVLHRPPTSGLIEIAPLVDLVYSPIMDVKEFPRTSTRRSSRAPSATSRNLHELELVRSRTKILVAFGDCAVTGNVPRCATRCGRPSSCCSAPTSRTPDVTPRRPSEPGIVPMLFDRVRPLHEVVPWISSCRAARRRRTSSTTCSPSSCRTHPGPPRPPAIRLEGTVPAWASASSSTPSPASRAREDLPPPGRPGEVSDARFHVVEFRGFEKFCEGRSFREMPGITARICGICPVSHMLTSAKAGDELLAVEIPEGATRLRRLAALRPDRAVARRSPSSTCLRPISCSDTTRIPPSAT